MRKRYMALDADDRQAFVDQVRRLLEERCSEADVRRWMETPQGHDPALWRDLCELGVGGLLVDAAHGGSAAGLQVVEQVMEEAGAVLLASPMVSAAVLAPTFLQALGDETACRRLLPDLASGKRVMTVALTGPRGGWRAADVQARAMSTGADGVELTGLAGFVTHGQVADGVIVVARADEGLVAVEIDAGARRLEVLPLPTFDRTLRLAELRFHGVVGRRLGSGAAVWPAAEAALDAARTALAGEQAGAARRVLEMTVDYARTRVQFGRPIGSFQAIKHMAADLLLESESAISAARAAARALDEGAPDAQAQVALAAFACADAFLKVTADAIQMHGGIAFTWNHPAHLYLRRARADAQLFGSPAMERERFLTALGA